ncbi:short-chain dehydrogenase/reductase SDR [Segniliparus rotundus DSM 44985]|uniref:Short-chain dehydrogenase/reductase SDR n=1 Tax=Segniliparus rotundus (strain ATCC BAA-972 / CDC 1076 / CIP 108378 / DSM 44985 / JCM 13578) TaxID=640132 RepID=D6ZAG1_SEGRD|nr:SDR family oxidoreductase [Segniliparus rotundus]ADG96703.1 short-chain dehydrogenase/reductase SDR [Segniliparus rotundus DSM 44985]
MSNNVVTGRRAAKFLSLARDGFTHWGNQHATTARIRKAAKDPSYGTAVRNKRVLVTGSSSGIGEQAARQLGSLGAEVILVARRAEELESVAKQIRTAGGRAEAIPCDLRELDAVDALCAEVVSKYGGVDVLVNNAGHSIRRSLPEQLARWHDIERVMQINYFSAMRLVRGFLPGMLERRDGHIINVASGGVLSEGVPKFAGYIAAKSALSTMSRNINMELRPNGVSATTLYYPLVRTPMIAPTEEYAEVPGLSAAQAAEWVVLAARVRPSRIAPRMFRLSPVFTAVLPELSEKVIGTQAR